MEIFNYLDKTISKDIPIAHLWYEESLNFGDSAIWVAQCKMINDLGLNIVYECNDKNYDENLMKEKIGSNGIILLRGGGNLNHIYIYHLLRLRIIDKFRNNTIIQLPQSIYFKDLNSDIFLITKRIFENHQNLIIMARDNYSFNFMQTNLPKINVLLFPDIATYLQLNNYMNCYSPKNDILWLMRYDKETKLCEIKDGNIIYPSIFIQKYLNDVKVIYPQFNWNNLTMSYEIITSENMEITDWYLCKIFDIEKYNQLTFQKKAEFGFISSIYLLQHFKFIITDRLHAYLIANHLHIPCIVIDNNNGKLTNYISTWNKNALIANNIDEAYEIANKYLHDTKIHQYSTFTFTNRYSSFFDKINIQLNPISKKILSFGCSSGEECITLKNIFKNCDIYGTDIRNDLEEICKSKNISFITSNNLPNYKFDMIFCMSILCCHPILNNKKNSSMIYPFKKFDELLIFIDSLLNVNGLLIIYNSNYMFNDSSIFYKYNVITIDEPKDELKKFDKNEDLWEGEYKNFIFKKIEK
jgi:pyruvyl transferase EpsO